MATKDHKQEKSVIYLILNLKIGIKEKNSNNNKNA